MSSFLTTGDSSVRVSVINSSNMSQLPEERDRSLLDEHREEINRATTISEIFNILCAYWNYLSYEVLEYIIEHYGTSDDTERLKSYDEEVAKFCECRILNFLCLQVAMVRTMH